jgi:hypothetical protein
MLRYLAGVASALLLVAGGFFVWKSRADAEDPLPPAPVVASSPAPLLAPMARPRGAPPPAATEKSKEEKRFGRADKDKDGRITLDELYLPRRKAFAKLDRNGDGRLAFEEWAASTSTKFAKADSDRSGWLSPREYESTKPKTKPKPKCRC